MKRSTEQEVPKLRDRAGIPLALAVHCLEQFAQGAPCFGCEGLQGCCERGESFHGGGCGSRFRGRFWRLGA